MRVYARHRIHNTAHTDTFGGSHRRASILTVSAAIRASSETELACMVRAFSSMLDSSCTSEKNSAQKVKAKINN
jgi:hypothetical protein